MCLVPSNPDISGIGVRIAIYLQNLLCFFPAVWAIWDWEVTDYELESAETQSTTNLVLAFAILISCVVQALTLGLTNYHATIVLSLSWMNNTNAFVYFLLYVHYKSQGVDPQVAPQWSSWIKHIKDQTKSLFTLPSAMTAVPHATIVNSQAMAHTGRKDGKGGVKVLFRRIALLLGSLHLTLMAALGIWLWSNPRSFGISDASCAVDFAHLAIVGARVPFGSNPLRVISLAIYSLFLLPGFNLLLPMAAFLGLYLWHHARRAKMVPLAAAATPATTSLPIRARIARVYRTAMGSPVFPIGVGLALLFAINVVFIADIELTLRRNKDLQSEENEETQWGFGQILAMLLVFMPLRDIIDMILARRLRRQEEQIRRHELTASWKGAILTKDVDAILRLLKEGADPNVPTEDGWTALEVVTSEGRPDAVDALANAAPRGVDINALFHDGRTAVEVSALEEGWETLEALLHAKANINATNQAGKTALEVASLADHWDVVEGLLKLGADVNVVFTDGRTALELATDYGSWRTVQSLVNANAMLNVPFKDSARSKSVLHSACQRERDPDMVEFLLDKGADPNLDGGVSGSPLRVACDAGALDIVKILLEAGVDPNRQDVESKLPLQAACSAGSFHIVELLLEKGADPNLQNDYRLPLQTACAKGSFKIVKLLLEKGADPNLQGGEYGSALQIACCTSHQATLKIVRHLLRKGADPNLQGGIHGSSLQAACCRSSVASIEVVQALLEKGADPNLQGGKYGSPLQAACNKGTPAIVEVLLQKGAKPNVKGGVNGTPLHSACALARFDVIRVLLKYHANPMIQDDDGTNAVELAITLMKREGMLPYMSELYGVIALLLLDNLNPGASMDTGENSEPAGRRNPEAELDSSVADLFGVRRAVVDDIGERDGGGDVETASHSSDDRRTDAYFRSHYGVTLREARAIGLALMEKNKTQE